MIMRSTLSLAALLLAPTPARATNGPGRGDLDRLYDRVAADLRGGRPLVVQVHVPLCSNEIIRCGSARLGDGDNPRTNLYWATTGGFKGWFGRKAPGWNLAHVSTHDGQDVLEVRAWHRRFRPGARWRTRGVTRAFDVYVVAHAWRGSAIDAALEAYVDDLYGRAARTVRLSDGTVLDAGGAAHVVAFVGHNRWMDRPPYDWARAARRIGSNDTPKGTIAIACKSAEYLARDVPSANRVPLLMTTQFMFAGAHAFEGAATAFAKAGSLRAIRTAAARNHAIGQRKPFARVLGLFTNPSHPRWRRYAPVTGPSR
jgi:hypothetical protein